MQAERFRQIRNLFDAALERDQAARSAFLQEACHGDETLLMEVGKLLAAHGEPTAWIDEGVIGAPLPRLEGRRIGAYEILRQLGEGGMGAVYLAARADGAFRKMVALKIVRPAAASEQVLQRFQREREILASLDHPNIARIVDGGMTDDSLPFLVMDYVDGEPIDAYCDNHRLDVAARLKLFRDVCAAVQYAHDHHVVHRDLKPSNILVTKDGAVKLLDFGIAKLTAQDSEAPTMLTRSDMCLMTPEYASPEQVTGGSTTPSTDVYSLGVVLYELLTGRRPYRLRSRIIHEVVRVICEEPPTRPSAAVMEKEAKDPQEAAVKISRARAVASAADLKRQLKGDVDYILLKALEKDPIRRYSSAGRLSSDVEQHLEGLGVDARRQVLGDAVAQFPLRNRWWLIAAGAAALAIYNRPGTAVRVLTGLLIALPYFVLLFGAYRTLVRYEGPRRARRAMSKVALGISVTALFAVAWVSLDPLRSYNGLNKISFPIVLPIALTICSWSGGGLLFRERYLGLLRLDLTRPSKLDLVMPAMFATVSLLMVWIGWTHHEISGVTAWLMVPFCIVATTGAYMMFRERFEIRERGFVLPGATMIPWSKVLSYHWEPEAGEYEVLEIQTKGFWRWNKTSRILVVPADRPQVNAIFERQLAEWPSA
jgi:serine/threonine protein kinase